MKTPLNAEHALEWLRQGAIEPPKSMDPRGGGDNETLNWLAARVRAAFTDYPDVLQLLLEQSLFRPPVDARLTGEDFFRHALIREGQNQLATGILAYIDHAKTLEKQANERTARRTASPDVAADPGAADDPFLAYRG